MKKINMKTEIKCTIFILLALCISQNIWAECGDVNANGTADIIDALMIAQYYVGLEPAITDLSAGDVNGNGAVDIVDALQIAQYYVGLIASFPGCSGTPGPTDPPQDNDCYYVPVWSATTIYNEPGMRAQYNGNLYENKWYTENQNPELNSGELEVWTLIAECDPNSTPVPGTPISTPTATPGPATTPEESPDPNRTQEPYPPVDASECGSWILKDNVCTARYCSDNLLSEDCAGCGGNTGALCQVVSSKAAVSGAWPPVTSVGTNEPWHFSRSTHYGIGKGGACAFGLYGICSSAMKPGDPFYNPECEAFCKAYPDLCAEPAGNTFRGNWAAPQGNYYTQFWANIPGARDNYLSCGECFELVRIKKDGTDYQPGETGYTPPVTLVIADSCPCSANSKWCCGAGRNHCYEVADFKYGCPMPPIPTAPPDRDPIAEESIHIDLCSIAMARLQSGSANGGIVDGVIPTKYRRVPCPVVGNIHTWLLTGASKYYFALTVVNVKGLGSVARVEAQMGSGEWAVLQRDPNYTSARPQERYGTWVTTPGAGPFELPVSLRLTNAAGVTLLSEGAIKAWAPTDTKMAEMYFIDTGVQF